MSSRVGTAMESLPQDSLLLRPPETRDEGMFIRAQMVMEGEGFSFGPGYEIGMDWMAYLRRLDDLRAGVNLAPNQVATALLIADLGGQIVGRVNIRPKLNELLASEGGHIGYGVLPEYRRRGYATEMLRQGVDIAHQLGVERVLVVCDESNTASARVIERCGGVFESSVIARTHGQRVRRYWIDN
jgi:predicted acetyltransferase